MDEVLPITHLMLISDHCPRAMATYLLCWQYCNEERQIAITDSHLDKWNISRTRIKNDLRALAKEGVLEYFHTMEYVQVTLAEGGDV